MRLRDMVLVGGGLAATRCAQTLRSKGFEGRLTVVCAESHPPYDRPPLSKAQLASGNPAPPLLRPREWWADNDVDLRLGTRAQQLEPGERLVLLDDGTDLPYDRVLLATGAAPRTPPPGLAGRRNVHTLRNLGDAVTLRGELAPGTRLLIIGAGLIGLEVASTAQGLGCEVTVLEAADRPLARALPAGLADWLVELHRRHGIRVELAARLQRVEGSRDATAVVLDDGRRLRCDVVLAATGVEPRAAWLAGSGLPDRDGIPVDGSCRTAMPGVFAAGDCALTPDPATGQPRRSDHWEAAVHTGRAAAMAMLDLPAPPQRPPGFWTDQHGVRLQVVGEAATADALPGDGRLDQDDFHVLLTRGSTIVAGAAANRPRELPRLRALIDTHQRERIPA